MALSRQCLAEVSKSKQSVVMLKFAHAKTLVAQSGHQWYPT